MNVMGVLCLSPSAPHSQLSQLSHICAASGVPTLPTERVSTAGIPNSNSAPRPTYSLSLPQGGAHSVPLQVLLRAPLVAILVVSVRT